MPSNEVARESAVLVDSDPSPTYPSPALRAVMDARFRAMWDALLFEQVEGRAARREFLLPPQEGA
jgi:hypothetical protein